MSTGHNLLRTAIAGRLMDMAMNLDTIITEAREIEAYAHKAGIDLDIWQYVDGQSLGGTADQLRRRAHEVTR